MGIWMVYTADDNGCGVIVKRSEPSGFLLVGIESGIPIGIKLSPDATVRAVGTYLMAYEDDGLPAYPSPETGERARTDWSATVTEGHNMFTNPHTYVDDMFAALNEEDD
jgi:hypothetical protein